MIGVVADDTTGALDIGVMFHRAGCHVQVLTHPVSPEWSIDAEVNIIDTDSRLDGAGGAYDKVAAATRLLRDAGCSSFHKKTCSVFRGNIGAEFDAMLDTLNERGAIISLAYPFLGRTTRDGRHFVQGIPLESSAFAHDPVHPRRTGDLRAILAEQSARPSTVVPLAAVRAGAEALRAALQTAMRTAAYVIVDGETQADLATLAEAAADFPVLGGSAGLALLWPRFLPGGREHLATPGGVSPQIDGYAVETPPAAHAGILYISGSLTPQSKEQVSCLRAAGVPHAAIAPIEVSTPAESVWAAHVAAQAADALRRGESFLLTTAQNEMAVADAHAFAHHRGWDEARLGKEVSKRLSIIVERIFECASPSALIVAGGDTSGAICRRLGLTRFRLLGEVATGVPVCLAPDRQLIVVLKSGSFGGPDFFLQAGAKAIAWRNSIIPQPA